MKKPPKKSLSRVVVKDFSISNELPFTLIAGPCIMESREHLWTVASSLKKTSRDLGVNLIFKCSFDKANRSSHLSYRGPGIKKGLSMLSQVKREFDIPILTDVHLPQQVPEAAKVADVLQVPAFLCRQSDLLEECARSGRVVNVKKGQFLSPWEMKNILGKMNQHNHSGVLLTERGNSFGYNNLVVDMRSLEIMKKTGAPVVFDATHSVQLPGGQGKSSGGQREFVETLCRAAVAVGIAALFMEVHPQPDRALSDGPNCVKCSDLENLLEPLIALDKTTKRFREVQTT